MTEGRLSELVAARLQLNWERFRSEHPGLAGAMERTDLVEAVVSELRDDPAYREAMAMGELDERSLVAAAQVLDRLEVVLSRAMGL